LPDGAICAVCSEDLAIKRTNKKGGTQVDNRYYDLNGNLVDADLLLRKHQERQAEVQRQQEAREQEEEKKRAAGRAELAQWAAGEEAKRQAALDARQAERDAARQKAQEDAEAELRDRARVSYPGTDASFEADWPAIRAELMRRQVAGGVDPAREPQSQIYKGHF
jgi:hypothetical protein